MTALPNALPPTRLLWDALASRRRVATNSCHPLLGKLTSSLSTRHYRKTYVAARHCGFRALQFTFANWFIDLSTGLTVVANDLALQASVQVGAVAYDLRFGGAASVTLPGGTQTTLRSDPLPCWVPPGAKVIVVSRLSGFAASADVPVGQQGQAQMGDGFVHSTAAVDWRRGGWGTGAVLAGTFSSGVLQSVAVTAGGRGYAAGAGTVYNLSAQPVQGSGAAFTLAVDGSGTVTGASVTAGGSGYDPTLTQLVPSSANNALQPGSVFGPILVTGVPDGEVEAMLMLGDSLTIGLRSFDVGGDAGGGFGLFDRALSNRIGVARLALAGLTSTGLAALLPALLPIYAPVCTLAHIFQGTNDLSTVVGADTLSSNLAALGAMVRGYGLPLAFQTLMPHTSGTFASPAGQSAFNTNYGAGGTADTVNARIRAGWAGDAGYGLQSDWTPPDAYAAVVDPTAAWKWRSDGGAWTADGLHPTYAHGLPAAAALLQFPESYASVAANAY